MIKIEIITPDLAEELCRKITADLPEYFGLPEVNEHYAFGVRSRINLAARLGKEYVGLISIDFPYPENSNIYWLGILRDYHRTGIGKILSDEAFKQAKNRGAKTISVETLSPEEADENYLKTYQFYKSLGFAPLFNLKPEGYEWNMVYMLKSLNNLHANRTSDVFIRPLIREDIVAISEAFNQIGWNKTASLFEGYLKEQEAGERIVWMAHVHEQFAGYIILKWQSQYPSFKAQRIPEIMDLNILPCMRKMGIGSFAKERYPEVEFIARDMRGLKLNRKFDLIIAWHSFFHLSQNDQREMFKTFTSNLKNRGVLMFTSGPQAGEVWSDNGGENLYHASLSPDEYKKILKQYDFTLIDHKIDDPECGDATIWLARLDQKHQE